ncbi:MAG TPA: head GIN domain-containing protein [Casimicrobiaceae bacterium]
MRRFALPALILAAVVVAAVLAWYTLTRGGGPAGTEMTTEVRAVEPFNRLEINGRADVMLVQGERESITVQTAARGQSRVVARVEKGTLMINAGVSRRWWSGLVGGRAAITPRIVIAFNSLDAIAVSGAVQLLADKIQASELRIAASGGSVLRLDGIAATSLRLNGSGALKATLAGAVVEQRISISGAGEVRADKLVSQDAVVDVSGAGSIVVNVAQTLRASISGAGSVEYYGDPDVKQSVSGIGRVKRRAAAEGRTLASDRITESS